MNAEPRSESRQRGEQNEPAQRGPEGQDDGDRPGCAQSFHQTRFWDVGVHADKIGTAELMLTSPRPCKPLLDTFAL